MKFPKKNKSKDGKVNIIYFDKKSNQKANKPVNKKKIAGIVILLLIILAIAITYILYATNEEIRTYFDNNILHKNIDNKKLKTISIEDYDKSHIFAYSDKILVLKDNTLSEYNASGNKENDLKIEISMPLTYSNDHYFMIAEKNSNKVYMITDGSIKWEKTLEGNISRISVNENGYSSVVLSGTAYKSVVILFDDMGNELFRRYLSITVAVDSAISDDNKYLSIAEVNTTGTLIQSTITVLSVEKARTDAENSIVYTYTADANSLILNIKYQNRTRLICMYDDSIHVIKDNTDSKILNIKEQNEKVTFSSIELEGAFAKTSENTEGLLNTQTTVKIINTNNKKESTYKFDGVTKEFYCSEDKIAVNLGSEVHFIVTNGWLIKRYSSNQEIRNIVISGQLAGIVYRNRIEIIKF